MYDDRNPVWPPVLPPGKRPPSINSAPPSGGFLSLDGALSVAPFDLSALGLVEWRQYDNGAGNRSVLNTAAIAMQSFGGAFTGTSEDAARPVIWTGDGTPNPSGSSIWVNFTSSSSNAAGRRLIVRAGTQRQILVIPATVYNAQLWATASMGDGSAPTVNKYTNIIAGGGAAVTGDVTVTFQAAADNQLMTVDLWCDVAGSFASAGLQGAALRNA